MQQLFIKIFHSKFFLIDFTFSFLYFRKEIILESMCYGSLVDYLRSVEVSYLFELFIAKSGSERKW